MTKNTLLDVFDVKKTSPLYSFADNLSTWIMRNVKEKNIIDIYDNYVGGDYDNLSTDEMINEIVEDYGGIDKEMLEKVASKEIRYYEGSASSESGDALEYYIYEGGLNNIETDAIKMTCEN